MQVAQNVLTIGLKKQQKIVFNISVIFFRRGVIKIAEQKTRDTAYWTFIGK